MLCTKCSGKAFIRDVGACKDCKAPTNSSAIKLCNQCSSKKKECAACGVKLTGKTK